MTNKEIKALISLLDDPEIAPQIQGKIQSLGESIIPFLEESWEESLDPQQQQRLEDLIHNLQFEGLQQRLRVWRDSGGENLLEGMWLLNSYQYPDADLQALGRAIEQLRFEVWTLLRPDMHPADQVQALNYVLFRTHKFAANTQNFHSPANSMLHLVLETRRGNPLTLCVIYLLVAQRLNLPIFGVNLPNLFVLTYQPQDLAVLPFYINCYNRGLILSRTDIEHYVAQLNLSPNDIFYEPCSHLDIVRRALRNLMMSFEKMQEPAKAAEVGKLLAILTDDAAAQDTEPQENDGE
ncbi:Regulator of sirC expression, contains transglutaminase-like and TPR domains [Hymenobacter daecheongensis DSM 21074]|uniref:Regulator of sirC expression, contains transglutaminase-like and TPR domains n=1 Tax=Hymenobacter daecheongensis DSM 21074 TaxID=1121955 RepID=A0A1M6CHR8_9BACT|nr:transglutaminase-like domain-containing protein [Hymenobacter daecheongensis]SHI60539.1 Regulator of sirC expression, contains transglutaminase-like and TPR domains [Hymenobacter daecheongensis DSM 21074]